jgi:hypothetical protein
LFSVVPAPGLIAALDANAWLNQYVIPIGFALLLLLGPHVIAAEIFARDAKFPVILAACLLQVAFAFFALLGVTVLWAAGTWYLAGGGAVVFILSVLVMMGLYRFDFARGVGYNVVVVLLAAGISWAVYMAYGETYLKKHAMPYVARIESRRFKTEEDAQRAAVKEYPDLGAPGSAFNQKFLEKHSRYKTENPEALDHPGWPWVIAREVAVELASAPAPAPAPAPKPTP